MSFEIHRPSTWSVAWRISIWGTVVFALGTTAVFMFLHRFVEGDIQRRNDAWLWGEVSLLADVSERTPKDALYGQIVGEIAELVRRGIPTRSNAFRNAGDYVFFLEQAEDGSLMLWVGAGDGERTLAALQAVRMYPDQPSNLLLPGGTVPFRVVSLRTEDGGHIYLGLSEIDEIGVLRMLRLGFLLLWLVFVFFGFAAIFLTTRRMLSHVQAITETASTIGRSGLSTRIPTTGGHDEVESLASTLNHMLDRIESTMHQLHTMTDSLAHDIRSPLTAVRGRLEELLPSSRDENQAESIVSCIEMVDRLSQFLTESLDVAEASADALRLNLGDMDLDAALKVLLDLYQPGMIEKGMSISYVSDGPTHIVADAALINRVFSNLFDNEITHVPAACSVSVSIKATGASVIILVEDDGPGFGPDIVQTVFERSVRGLGSRGHGLGLAFVDAVVRAHGGTATAMNREPTGARLVVVLPRAANALSDRSAANN
jgi:signal transduction histidine kinase